jgi:8-oxo-dGTP pyrophosphatase MutT (NUDIX family)
MTPTRSVTKVVVVNDAHEVLLLRRSKTAPRRALQWDFPGGLVDDGEELAAAASRELTEEAALDIAPADLKLIWANTDIVDDMSVTWLMFIAKAPHSDITLSYEHDKFCWLPIEDAITEIQYPLQKTVLRHIQTNQLMKLVA